MRDFFTFINDNQALSLIVFFAIAFLAWFFLSKFSSIKIGSISLNRSNTESIKELKDIILELQSDNKVLLQRLNEIEIRLQVGVIVNKYTLLRMESDLLYNKCINKQRDIIDIEIEEAKIEQMRLFREIFCLGINDNDYIRWGIIVDNICHVVRVEANRLIEKNHFDYKVLMTEGLFRDKWEQYKLKKGADIWDLCIKVMHENFSLHNFGIKLNDIALKAKPGFYEVFAKSNNKILEAYLTLNLQKDNAFEKFRKDHGIEDDFIDQDFF